MVYDGIANGAMVFELCTEGYKIGKPEHLCSMVLAAEGILFWRIPLGGLVYLKGFV